MSDRAEKRKNRLRDPIYVVARAIRVLKLLSPTDREYAFRKANEEGAAAWAEKMAARASTLQLFEDEPTGHPLPPPPRGRCRNCGVPILKHEGTGIWLHVPPGSQSATTRCWGTDGAPEDIAEDLVATP